MCSRTLGQVLTVYVQIERGDGNHVAINGHLTQLCRVPFLLISRCHFFLVASSVESASLGSAGGGIRVDKTTSQPPYPPVSCPPSPKSLSVPSLYP